LVRSTVTPSHARTDLYEHLSAESLRGWQTEKWSYCSEDVLPAWVAEMDFPTAPVIQQAVIDAVRASETNYAPASHAVHAACAEWLAQHTALKVDPWKVFVAGDVIAGTAAALDMTMPAGCPIIVPTPTYPPFFDTVRDTGRTVVEVPMRIAEERWGFDLDAIDEAFRDGARGIVICHPHNPLGRVFGVDELAVLAEVVERHGARAVVDEVHAPLTYDGIEFRSYATISPAAAEHATTVTSASKGWNVAGLKCAQVIVTRESDYPRWDAMRHGLAHGASTLGLTANRVAYADGGPWLRETVAYLQGNRDLLAALVPERLPGITWIPPQATYLAWLDCRGLDVPNPAQFFLDQARVMVNDGAMFGAAGRGFVRLNFGTSRRILTEIVDRLARAVAG
jgi:cysteine-S-conjugate beta-lyase